MEAIDSILLEETQKECLYCESHVDPKTAKIFGDNDNELYACPTCATSSDLMEGAGADPTYDNHKI